jgi:hypothetical protein
MDSNVSQNSKRGSSWASAVELTESERELMERETQEMFSRAKAVVYSKPRRYQRKKAPMIAAE